MDDWTLLFLTISLCFASKFLLSKLSNASKKKPTLPPGPGQIPILSSILWLQRSLFDIEPIVRSLRAKYGPIFTLRITSRPAVFVADRDLAHQALVQAGAAFADRLGATESSRILTSNRHNISSAPYGPVWRLLRRNLAAEILHPSRVKLFAPARRWVLRILVDNLKAKAETGDGVVVVMESFQYAMFCLLVFMCFGERLDEKDIRDIEAVQRHLLSSSIKSKVHSSL